ncbi:FHA domain-containing protein [Variovorax boronicumulans]|uniref:FHA domain-containing protein n=1 Tax=Variovorax boronicumulans TaxID=436515 RepID=A0AAW8E7Y5_9BURK|nr:type VI secretion system-associated FHA domain protein TagH [Variovorax boronicumulans]MDP9882222.1 FHA domain-containing protein [Variovorax boronicumulans]MDP9920287.1 FHA domain-containing protein [Variovorax boronicumulans]MDP9927449.1 FHA domain-containing protein [Variovorax boronicumulans]
MRWTVIEHGGMPVASGPSALLAAPGGTIGRSPDNHLVLPDEHRQISRLQATVRFDDEGAAVVRNMSAVLPISVNGRTLRHEEESRVALGDRVTIGSYVLEAASASQAPPPAIAEAPITEPLTEPPAAPITEPPLSQLVSAPPVASHLASAPSISALLPTAAQASDVFADLFGEGALPLGDAPPEKTVAMPTFAPAPVNAPAPAPLPAPPPPFSSTAAAPSTTTQVSAQMPSAADWDAILANAPRRADDAAAPMPDPLAHEPFALPSQAQRNPVDPLAELDPQATQGLSDLALKRSMDPLSFFAEDRDAPSPLSDPRPTALTQDNPLDDVHPAMDLIARPPAAPSGHSLANHAREMTSQFNPPQPVAITPSVAVPEPVEEAAPVEEEPVVVAATEIPVAPAVPEEAPPALPVAAVPAPAPSSPRASSSGDDLFRAFLEGAGVPEIAGQQPLDAEAMRHLGRLMRAFTDGTIELLSSRAMLKREVRAEITMIVDEENNPFKILPNGRAVLMQMFGARMPGFLTPEAAVHDALGDLQSHQLGMVAGMRAALLTLLHRFDPGGLDKATPHDGGLGEKFLPGGREARLWRQLKQLHASTTAAVEDDFQAVFGRAFQQAYDREMERLKEARRA